MVLKISIVSVSLVMFALVPTLPARAQVMMSYPPVIIVPSAQNYAVKSTNRPTAPDKLKALVDPPAPVQSPIYQGRTVVR
jgi:hypothetical protein